MKIEGPKTPPLPPEDIVNEVLTILNTTMAAMSPMDSLPKMASSNQA